MVVTSLCDRNCKYCCNKKYDIHNLEYATDEDFKSCELLCLTGGEPFTYANPVNLARKYRTLYPNIKNVVIYTNAYELMKYLLDLQIISMAFEYIDGLSISVKNPFDAKAFMTFMDYIRIFRDRGLKLNRVYDFTGYINKIDAEKAGFTYIRRKWQEDFNPAPNCIFRRGN